MVVMLKGCKRNQLVFLAFVGSLVVMIIITASLHGKALNDLNVDTDPMVTDVTSNSNAVSSASSLSSKSMMNISDPDADCPFRHSPLYRSIFVYPSPRDPLFLSMKAKRAGASNNGTLPMWPWLEMNDRFRETQFLIYNLKYHEMNHFSLEQYVHDIMTHSESCLQTNDPEMAKLFYVPLLETLHWRGLENLRQLPDEWVKKRVTPYGEALLAAIEGKYALWEDRYGLTSRYWQRKSGADHFFVMAEPCNGLRHLPGARGNRNYVHTQRQNRPPIVISQELSATYVQMYPKCAAKNIVMPYANIDGNWFNGNFEQETRSLRSTLTTNTIVTKDGGADDDKRPILVHYKAGSHGQCTHLRRNLLRNHRCGKSFSMVSNTNISRPVRMHLSTFCPCPAGDSPSARRMNDAVVAGCIPVILSTDYVWPLSKDVDPTSNVDPFTFSIRLNFSDFGQPLFQGNSKCIRVDKHKLTLEEYLESIPNSEIRRLQEGMKKVASQFLYYQKRNMSSTPLSDHLLPDGGAAHALVHELAKRAVENRWEQCKVELKGRHPPDPKTNPC